MAFGIFRRLLPLIEPDLGALLAEGPRPGREADWLEHLMAWVRGGGQKAAPARLKHVLERVWERPDQRRALGQAIASVIARSSPAAAFAEAGLHNESEIVREAWARVERRYLPQPPREWDLQEVIHHVFPTRQDARMILSLPTETMRELIRLVGEQDAIGAAATARLRDGVHEALRLLAIDVMALGLSSEIRARRTSRSVKESPFSRIHSAVDRFLEAPGAVGTSECLEAILDCRSELDGVVAHLEQTGITLALVFRIERITQILDRIELLLLHAIPAAEDSAEAVRSTLARLVHGTAEDHSLRALLGANMARLARKLVERTGETGEHYITRTPAEYRVMLLQAMGGGALTVGTILAKYLILSPLRVAPFVAAVGNSVNYAGSFLIMQALGFKLATKQPAMTAAALAGKLRETRNMHEFNAFIEEVMNITRSQAAAAIGNLFGVFVVALSLDRAFELATSRHLLSATTSQYVVHSLQPLTSLTLAYAALTGVVLWLSGLFSGWLENAVVYRHLPEAIAANRRLHRAFGAEFARKLSVGFSHHIAGVGSSVSLGILLGFIPTMGTFLGLPLDVRHVTLSAGSLALAVSALPASSPGILSAAVGVLCIGILNFGVSFALALFVAIRARRTSLEWVLELLGTTGQRFLRRPWAFVLPVDKGSSR